MDALVKQTVMKSLRKLLCVVLLGVALIFAIPAFAQQKSGQVTITDTRIEIHPGTKISESDEKALNAVLQKYDKSLYKIQTSKEGKVQVQGRLEDKHVDTKLAAEVKRAKASGMSVHMEQVVDHKTNPPPPGPGGIKFALQAMKSKEFIESVKPILEKYTKK